MPHLHPLSARRPAALLLGTLLGACSGSGGAPVPLHTTIGPAGGTLMIGIGELTLTVPPGALRSDVSIQITAGQASTPPGWLAVSAPYRLAPTATAFAAPAQLLLPFDPSLLSSAVDSTELRVGFGDATGAVTTLVPTFADPGGSVMLDIDGLGTFWTVAPDVVSAHELLPLNDADVYTFDSELSLTVARSTVEPHFAPGEIVVLTFAWQGREWGLYCDDQLGQWNLRGAFSKSDWQEVTSAPVPLLSARDGRNSQRIGTAVYPGYVPYGGNHVGYQGLAQVTTEVGDRARLQTPLGLFDTDRIVVTQAYSNSWPEQGETRLELWCARGVGPVALRFDDQPLRMNLVAATVGGNEVHGR